MIKIFKQIDLGEMSYIEFSVRDGEEMTMEQRQNYKNHFNRLWEQMENLLDEELVEFVSWRHLKKLSAAS